MRTVSLAPTQTEIIAALGAIDDLIGVSEDCDYPPAVTSIPTFGSWYAPDVRRVIEQQPDLVCTFGSHQEEISELMSDAGLRVYHSDPATVAAALATFEELAQRLDRERAAAAMLTDLGNRLTGVAEQVRKIPRSRRPRVLRIMEWDPLISVGPGAFQHDVIEAAGGINLMEDAPAPYFHCDPELVLQRDPQVIFWCVPRIRHRLEAEPRWRKTSAFRQQRLHLFDCGLTCRSGPRIVAMVEALAAVLHPVTVPNPAALPARRNFGRFPEPSADDPQARNRRG